MDRTSRVKPIRVGRLGRSGFEIDPNAALRTDVSWTVELLSSQSIPRARALDQLGLSRSLDPPSIPCRASTSAVSNNFLLGLIASATNLELTVPPSVITGKFGGEPGTSHRRRTM